MGFNVTIRENENKYRIDDSGNVSVVTPDTDMHIDFHKDVTRICGNVPKRIQEHCGNMSGRYIGSLFKAAKSVDKASVLKVIDESFSERTQNNSSFIIIDSVHATNEDVSVIELMEIASNTLVEYIANEYRDYRNLVVCFSLNDNDYSIVKDMQIKCVKYLFDDVSHSVLIR